MLFYVLWATILDYVGDPTISDSSYVVWLVIYLSGSMAILVLLSVLVLSLTSVYSGWRRSTWNFLGAVCLMGLFSGSGIIFLADMTFLQFGPEWTGLCAPIRISDPSGLPVSQIGPLPQTFRACEARVAPQQSLLFTESIYWDQYPRLSHFFPNRTQQRIKFNEERFLTTRHNTTLCYPGKEARDLEAKGFQANEDLYGQGVRAGIYLNWIASLLANQLLPTKKRKAIQKTYLLTFNTVVCLATYFEIFRPCVFGIEIEVLYWAYWGGTICVFTSAPNETRLGDDDTRWTQLDWITAVRYISNSLMAYHGFWFTWYGYDNSYARMPCGTYQFIFGRLLDPSPSFCMVRYSLTTTMSGFFILIAIAIPLVVVLLASEIKGHVLQTFTYGSDHGSSNPVLEGSEPNQTPQTLTVSNRLLSLFRRCKRWYGRIREIFDLPSHAQPGIRLITPLDEKNRK